MKPEMKSSVALVLGCWIVALICVIIGGVATCCVFGFQWSWPTVFKLTTVLWVIQLLYIIIFRKDY